jgi:hypothetical protein
VLNRIDEILAWEQRKETEGDTKFEEPGRYLCEVREGQYWRLEKLKASTNFWRGGFLGRGGRLLPDDDSRTPAAAGEKADEGSGLGEGNLAR